MENNVVPRERILLAKILVFESYAKGMLIIKKLPKSEEIRRVIFMDGKLIDFATRDELQHLNTDKTGIICPEIYANTMYIDQLYKYKELTQEEYAYAQELYAYYKERQKLIEEKKLILFKQKRIY